MKDYKKDEMNDDKEEKNSFVERLNSIKGVKFLVFGLLCGLVFLVVGNFVSNPDKDTDTEEKSNNSSDLNKFMQDYIDAAEQELRVMIEHIGGASNVRVMITLDCLVEYVYAQNVSGSGEAKTYATVLNSSREENMVLVKEVAPKIRGVAVVCSGGSNPQIQAEIINLCCSVFDINSNSVSVAEGK